MKRIISFILVLVILMGNSTVFAAPGDYIHTGLKRAYDVKNAKDRDALINDLKRPDSEVDKNLFYREVEGGKYVNVKEEEKAQENRMLELLFEAGIDSKDADKYFKDPKNLSEVIRMQNEVKGATGDIKEFSDIEPDFTKEYYYGGSGNYAPRLSSPENYSIPIPGTSLGTTMISELKLPSNATKWVYKVEKTYSFPKPDSIVADGKVYTKGTSVQVNVDDYFLLYATDLSNKVKAYASIKITSNMVRMPRVPAEFADDTSLEVKKATDVANAIKVSGLPSGTWSYFIRSEKLSNVYVDDIFDDAITFDASKEIIVASEDTVIDDNFVRYVYFINTDEKKNIVNYLVKEVKKADISLLPDKLVAGTNYVGPIQGSGENTTKFSDLKLEGTGGTKWQYKVGADVNVPIADSVFGGISYNVEENIPANVGDKLILAAVDGDVKIRAYALFTLTETHVKGKTPPTFVPAMIVAKGSAKDTTKVTGPTLPEGATKFMYAISNNMPKPALDRIYPGAKDYNLGDDILVEAGQTLYVFATDPSGKVKMYNVVELKAEDIKAASAAKLQTPTHYRDIVKGNIIGEVNLKVSTSPSLEALFTSPSDIKWRYKVSKDKIDEPEMNSFIKDTAQLNDGKFIAATEAELKSEDPFSRNLLLLATEGEDHNFAVKGYAIIPLTRDHIRYPSANELRSDNYSNPEKGSSFGTTKISTLNSSGIDDHKGWYYKVFKPAFTDDSPLPVEFKEVLKTTEYRTYTAGSLITANPGDYIVLVSVDGSRKALAYKNIKLEEGNVTAKAATLLRTPSHYEGPAPGSVANSTKFTKFHSEPSTTKWMYKIGSKSFGTIEEGYDGSTSNGFTEYNVGDNITEVKPSDWLLLVRTDNSYKVNGYVNIQLTQTHVRNEDAQELKKDNYKVGMGQSPSTTKLYDFNLGGIESQTFNGWKWMYKVLDTKLEGESLPYLNQKISDAINYTSGNDITVKAGNYLLLLATDSSGQIKAYTQFEIISSMVRESAPDLNVSIGPGGSIDRVKFIGTETSYMYKTDTKPIPSPALNDILYGATEYIIAGNVGISAKAGTHLTIYKVDGDNKILAYKSFVIKDTDIQKGNVVLEKKGLLEGSIKNGGEFLSFTLQGNDEWNDVKFNEVIRNKLYSGLKADKQSQEWAKIVSALQAGGPGNIFIDGKKISIRLPAVRDYDISEEQNITLIVPFEAVKDAINPITATNAITIKPTIDATISGTVVIDIVREKDINAGGATIVLTLKDAYWNMNVNNTNILSKSTVKDVIEQSTTNWAKIKGAVENTPSSVVVTNERVVTITLPKVADVNYGSSKEVISLTIDESLIQGADTDVDATPNFTIYPNVLKVEMNLDDEYGKVTMQAPDNKIPLSGNDIWKVKLTNSTFKEKLTDKDISITGLPPGIKTEITRLSSDELSIKMTGVATSSLVDGSVKLVIKGTAVTELNSIDSDSLELPYIKGTAMSLDLIEYEIGSDGIYLITPEGQAEKIKYSINSTNGINGDWHSPASLRHRVSELVGPMVIYVREEAQPKVVKKFDSINHPPAPVVTVSGYEYISKDGKNLVNITVNSDATDLQYRKNNDLDWVDLADNKMITDLDGSSILVLRKKGKLGKSGILPSLPTAKLNGLFLGDVKLDVANSRIDGATTQMQYSLNSDENGNGGSWNTIKTPNQVISFAKDNIVFIREGNSDINKKELGTVTQVDPLPSDFKDIDYNILNKTITNKSEYDLQYRIANGSWFNLDKKTADGDFVLSNVVFSPGSIEVRRRGASNELPSQAITIAEIPLPVDPPEIKFDNDLKTMKYLDGIVYKDLNNLFEYKLGANGDWKNGEDFSTDEGRYETVTVFVRKKPTDKTVASKEVSYSFTKGISLVNVSVNVAAGVVDGTTLNMEYSTDSTNGTNGNWLPTSNGKTSIKFVPSMNLYIREKGKPSTFKNLFLDLKRETTPDLKDVTYDVMYDAIYNPTEQNLEYRIAEGPWTRIDANSNKIPAGLKAGKLEFRKPATAGALESLSVTKGSPFDIIMTEGSAPVVEFNDTKNKIISINSQSSNDWGIFEYRIDSNSPSAWSNGVNLVTQDLSGDKNVEIRIKATATTLASKIATVKFTKNLELSLVTLSNYTKPYELNGTTTDMEYKIIYLDGKEVGWNKCLKDTTPLTGITDTIDIAQIILRDGRLGHRDNERILIHNADSAPVGVNITKYSYDDDGKLTVKLSGIDNTMEYAAVSSSWIQISGNEVNVGLDENSDLRVRVKATSEKLPSISTPRLNGLYLGKVAVDESKLNGTNTSMEYSLDGGVTWELAKEIETPIEMALGNKIMVRQINNHINIRTIGTVGKTTSPNPADIDYSIRNSRIVADTNLEYKIGEGPWISITESPVNDVVFTPGKLEFRTKSSGLNLASEPITKANIPTYGDTPEIRPINTGKKSIEYYDVVNKVWKIIDSNFEYRIGSNGDWKPASNFESDPLKDGKVMVFVRKVATHKTLPTIEKYVNFDANLTFSNVRVNIAKRLIENTTTSMEYSINSTDGLDGAWNPINSTNTNVSFVEGMSIWIREKGKPDNVNILLDKLERQNPPSPNELEYHIAMGTISNKSSYDLEFRIKKEGWKNLAANTTINIEFSDGSLEFRRSATRDKLESHSVEKTVIMAAASPPTVTYDDVSNKIVSINGSDNSADWTNYQYRIKGTTNWIQGELLGTAIDLSGDKIVEIRRIADPNTLASQIAEAKFTKNLELTHVKLSTHVNPLELNGTTTDMEYKIWLTNGSDTWVFNNGSEWTKCDKDNTKLHTSLTEKNTAPIYIHKIVIRDSRESQHNNEFTVYPKP